jgi:hypothetical protein
MSMRHYRTMALVAGTGLAAMLLAGCNDPQSVDLRAQRQESLGWTLDTMAKTEAGTNRSRAWMMSELRGQFERDMENSSKNPARLGAMIQNDFDRWKASQPLYNEVIQRQLRGKPENIGRTAAKIIW